MATERGKGPQLDLGDRVDLTKLNADAAKAGAAACRQSNGPGREGGRLADAGRLADKS